MIEGLFGWSLLAIALGGVLWAIDYRQPREVQERRRGVIAVVWWTLIVAGVIGIIYQTVTG